MKRYECDNIINGKKCNRLLFKYDDNSIELKCRDSKCKKINTIKMNDLLKEGDINVERR